MSDPLPNATLTMPFGIPASIHSFANSTLVKGVSTEGLTIIALPAAKAGATFIATFTKG